VHRDDSETNALPETGSPVPAGRRGRAPGSVRQFLALHPRLALAIRAAVAASAAWALVQLVPGPAADYPYYAPLGAVVATSSTLAGSARESLQAVTAIVLGAVVALAVESLSGPNVVTIATVIGIGVLLSGWQRLGTASNWLPTSALFVLVLGNDNPLHYVAGFAGLILMGSMVGLAVTAAFPPLPLTPAAVALARLRETLAEQLDDLVTGLQEEHPPTHDEWRRRIHAIDPVLAQTRTAVQQTTEAQRGNRIARRYRCAVDRQHQQARALERLAFLVEDLTHVVAETEIAEIEQAALGPPLRPRAATALECLARVLRSVDGAAADPAVTRQADAALESLTAQLRHARTTTGEDLFVAGSVVQSIRRSLDAVRRVETHEPSSS
jgi:uncharacterized membrane protein YgaE (UPF0421/DUF939 family)